jgi:hypothetical protein
MKSSMQQLQNRGFVPYIKFDNFEFLQNIELIWMLSSPFTEERTIAAQMLGERRAQEAIQALCHALKTEKKLYSKIAISEALSKIGYPALGFLIPLLGTIGENQYCEVPSKAFEKSGFPLPRDIVARTITRIGTEALSELEQVLISGKLSQALEAIDAIGFIAYYNCFYGSFFALNICLNRFSNNALIQWKILRVIQVFPQSKNGVEEYQKKIPEPNSIDRQNINFTC